MRNRTDGWRMVALAGVLLLATGASPEAGPPAAQGVSPEVRQEYHERMRAIHQEFRSRLRSLKGEYRARRRALRAEFEARHGVAEPQETPGPAPGPPIP
ncbi:MAG TPA: hypothetical protein VFV36_09635 [Candidatus Methylomirabilis sp.]|nr:hypothetical protein [Candidatus Methylomirabilis sp.]